MGEDGDKPRIRIIAYIERRFMYGMPGFFLDISIELESVIDGRKHWALLQHYGDGELYEKFETAAAVVRWESGFNMELLPEDQWGPILDGGRQRVSIYIHEFEPISKPAEHIVRDSAMLREIKRLKDDAYPERN